MVALGELASQYPSEVYVDACLDGFCPIPVSLAVTVFFMDHVNMKKFSFTDFFALTMYTACIIQRYLIMIGKHLCLLILEATNNVCGCFRRRFWRERSFHLCRPCRSCRRGGFCSSQHLPWLSPDPWRSAFAPFQDFPRSSVSVCIVIRKRHRSKRVFIHVSKNF
mmetsp:Transcript_30056/g.70874  ORF Transcript_30056/g.70874 Transcript_30056/m.70874 type:complete len:165 (+) Transcript_30056:847-1341(+)